jgi:hypothetical protein
MLPRARTSSKALRSLEFSASLTRKPERNSYFLLADDTPIGGQQSFASRSPITLAAFFESAEQPVGDAYPEGRSMQKDLRGRRLPGDEQRNCDHVDNVNAAANREIA